MCRSCAGVEPATPSADSPDVSDPNPIAAPAGEQAARLSDRVGELFVPGAVRSHVQPIVRILDGRIVAYEALARMDIEPGLGPDRWLAAAEAVGQRDELELACLAAAAQIGRPPGGETLFVNVGLALLAHPLALELRNHLPQRLVLELSERDAVDDYGRLAELLAAWRARGVGIAVDDVGSGWSSLRHVVQLRPDYIKLDRSLVCDADTDRSRQALMHAMVAFARESGCTVIAEGVERSEELDVLREAGVALVQGYLLARPAPPWPMAADPSVTQAFGRTQRDTSLPARLASTTDARSACEVVAEHLWRSGVHVPSVYLERGGVLRCMAQRGLWQVLDGMPSGTGITGRAHELGAVVRVDDITTSPDYLEAIPGIVAEICVPIDVGGRTVGALNIDSYVPLSPELEGEMRSAATHLSHRLEVVGTAGGESANQRLARHAAAITEIADVDQLEQWILAAAVDVSGLSSAALVRSGEDGDLRLARAIGPLAPALAAIPATEFETLRTLVATVFSCYTAGDQHGAGLAGIERLRAAGARTVVVVRLVARGAHLGLLIVTDQLPAPVRTAEAERMELLATHAATCLDNVATLASLREQARCDALTGLPNHSAFRESLDAALEWPDPGGTVLLLCDLDGFKAVNDLHGHLAGDEVLRATARSLASVVRSGEGPFRVGGDEFAVLLRGSGRGHARDVARRLRRAGSKVLGTYGAGISVGLAELGPDDTTTSLIERADLSLYRSKRARSRRVLAAAV